MSNPLGDAQDKVQDLSKDVSSMSEQVTGKSDQGSSTGGGTTNPDPSEGKSTAGKAVDTAKSAAKDEKK